MCSKEMHGATVGENAIVATDTISEPDIAEVFKKACEKAIPADSFVRTIAFATSQPEEVDISEILFRPTSQEF
ncbi:hypothetical protein [Chitinophaga sp. CF418]|uniref:hypothetical protein n=1 Tax=Chitinophaga sp. CF418 TaxID=1855287 RepID=UPI00165FD405|nr:hypothetical protein [Chitinophaga sp. CF418]